MISVTFRQYDLLYIILPITLFLFNLAICSFYTMWLITFINDNVCFIIIIFYLMRANCIYKLLSLFYYLIDFTTCMYKLLFYLIILEMFIFYIIIELDEWTDYRYFILQLFHWKFNLFKLVQSTEIFLCSAFLRINYYYIIIR